MISKTTSITSDNKYKVIFDFTPDKITQNRKNTKSNYTATHTPTLVKAEVKIGTGAWANHGINKTVTVTTDKNNTQISARATYRIQTEGYHWTAPVSYPFFWYGGVSGDMNKYNEGYFTNSTPAKPASVHTVCIVPSDWTYKSIAWSNWAKNHVGINGSWAAPGNSEQRNANKESATYSNGWYSDSDRPQYVRKGCIFTFEKTYITEVTSSGIAVNPNIPTVEVPSYKGDNGSVIVYYNSNNSGDGYIQIEAKCDNVNKTVMSYSNSPVFGEKWKKTLSVDFNSLYGSSYRGKDVYYRAKAKNKHGYESSWSDWKGVQRYNAIPTTPTNIRLTGDNYNNLKITWNAASDADNDSLTYDIWLTVKDKNGTTLKNTTIATNLTKLNYDYAINSFPEGCEIGVKIRAYDRYAYGSWSNMVYTEKGESPSNKFTLKSPVINNTNLYCSSPRFVFYDYDGVSEICVLFNGTTYTSTKNSDLFEINATKVIFKKSATSKIQIQAWMKNEYGEGPKTQVYNFTLKNATENIVEGNYIKYADVKNVHNIITDLSKAYNYNFKPSNISVSNYYSANSFNDCLKAINDINNTINNYISNSKFKITLISKEVVAGVTLADDKIWENLINDIKKI